MEKKPGVLERTLEQTLFASRWLLAPVYAGLALGLVALGIMFFVEMWHVFAHLFQTDVPYTEADLVLALLALVDMALVGSLIIMVMFSGYENFVSKLDVDGSDQLEWLGKLDANSLKLKVASSIVAISSIHLLKAFMGLGGKVVDPDTGELIDKAFTDENAQRLMWYVIIHLTFVVSALLMGVLDRIAFAAHRDAHPDKPHAGGHP